MKKRTEDLEGKETPRGSYHREPDPLKVMTQADFTAGLAGLLEGKSAEKLQPWVSDIPPQELSFLYPQTETGKFFTGIRKVVEIFKDHNIACCLVGGAARNILQGKSDLTDLDLFLTNLNPDEPIRDLGHLCDLVFGEMPKPVIGKILGRESTPLYSQRFIPGTPLYFALMKGARNEKLPSSLKICSTFDGQLPPGGYLRALRGIVADIGWASKDVEGNPMRWAQQQPREDGGMILLIPDGTEGLGLSGKLIDLYGEKQALSNYDKSSSTLHFTHPDAIMPKKENPTVPQAFFLASRLLRLINLANGLGKSLGREQFISQVTALPPYFSELVLTPDHYQEADLFLEQFRNLLWKGIQKDMRYSKESGKYVANTIATLAQPEVSACFPRFHRMLDFVVPQEFLKRVYEYDTGRPEPTSAREFFLTEHGSEVKADPYNGDMFRFYLDQLQRFTTHYLAYNTPRELSENPEFTRDPKRLRKQWSKNLFLPIPEIGQYMGGRDLIANPISPLIMMGSSQATDYLVNREWEDPGVRAQREGTNPPTKFRSERMIRREKELAYKQRLKQSRLKLLPPTNEE